MPIECDIQEGLLVASAAGGPSLQGLLELQATLEAGEWRRCSDTAQVAANYLRCHPTVAEVRYPGLTSDPDYREASSTLRGGFGPLVRVRVLAKSSVSSDCGEAEWLELNARKGPEDPHKLVLILEDCLRLSSVG